MDQQCFKLPKKSNSSNVATTSERASFCLFLVSESSKDCVVLPFPGSSPEQFYAIGSSPQADLKLEEAFDTSLNHAEIRRTDEFCFRSLPPETLQQFLRIGTFLTNYQLKDGTFSIANAARYGTLICRSSPFLVEPGSIENFQFGNLLLQISRY
jgi:hypothetical protein